MQRKTWGRIFVREEEDVARLIELLRTIDEYEVDGYLGDDIVEVWGGDFDLVYTHKFEMDIDQIHAIAWMNNIDVWCITGRREGYSPHDDKLMEIVHPRCTKCGERATYVSPEALCNEHWAQWWASVDRPEGMSQQLYDDAKEAQEE